MTGCEMLMNTLFANPAREHIDVKFFVSRIDDVSAEQFCVAALDMFSQMDSSTEGDSTFAESFEPREVKDLIAAI